MRSRLRLTAPLAVPVLAGFAALLLAALIAPPPSIAAPDDAAIPCLDDQDDDAPVSVRAPVIAALPILLPRTTPPVPTARLDDEPSVPSPGFLPSTTTAPRAPPLS